jgi:predicted nucleic acid-binding protein
MSEVVIFDTSVLVDEARTGRHRKRIESVEGLVRMSSVVLGELLRGVIGRAEHKFLRALLRTLARNHPILTPTRENWRESGEILAKIRAHQGFEPHKLRDLHFDVLIALTARSYGARLITTNRADFELISRYRQIKLDVWE